MFRRQFCLKLCICAAHHNMSQHLCAPSPVMYGNMQVSGTDPFKKMSLFNGYSVLTYITPVSDAHIIRSLFKTPTIIQSLKSLEKPSGHWFLRDSEKKGLHHTSKITICKGTPLHLWPCVPQWHNLQIPPESGVNPRTNPCLPATWGSPSIWCQTDTLCRVNCSASL